MVLHGKRVCWCGAVLCCRWTPLHLASRAGNAEKVRLLLAAGSDVSATNAQGNSPLHLAAVNGHAGACKVRWRRMAALSANVHWLQVWSGPHAYNVVSGTAERMPIMHLRGVQVLLEYGADRAAPNKEGKKPLDIAKNEDTKAALSA